jgi:tRNA(Ile2) C34 agmatinyltransferase TiaS
MTNRHEFANEGSALRASSRRNPRNLPCPTCGEPNRLTPADRSRGYQCDTCAARAEGTYMGGDY